MNEIHKSNGYTPKQVAEMLGYKVDSIYALLSRKEMSASKIGKNRVISESQLNDLLHRRSNSEVVIYYTK